MNLDELNSGAGAPRTKPWLNIVANTIEVQDATVHGRVTQESGLPTPYSMWASLGSFSLAVAGVSTFSMGTFAGQAVRLSTSLYPGTAMRVVVGGTVSTALAVASNAQFSIRDVTGVNTYASVTLAVPGTITDAPFEASFEIQINALGGPGTGSIRSISKASAGLPAVTPTAVNTIADAITFDSTAGIGLYLWMSNSGAGASINRTLGYATVLY